VDYNVFEYGAKGDGITKDTGAIQAAINKCYANGGGRVVLPGGKTYLSGSIILKSNVNLHVEQGAVLKASEDLADFRAIAERNQAVSQVKRKEDVPSYINSEYNGEPFHYFIYAKKEENISITGAGAIDGSEAVFHGPGGQYHREGLFYPRIPMFLLEDIAHLTIKNITMKKCAFWTLHMVGCYDVLVDGIRILNSLKMANSDGIDPDHCKNVRIVNCHIECADDCIVFKNTKSFREYGACENILVSGCTLISTSAAVKFGTESEDDFKNIVIENCNISRSNRGLSLQLRDGGNIENVQFSNINIETRRFSEEWWGRAEPICITAIDRKEGVKAGKIKNIRFQNINCQSENGIFISGSKDNYIEDICLENVKVTIAKTSKWPADSYDLRPCAGSGMIKRKISGMYADFTKGLTLRNVTVEKKENMAEFIENSYELKNVDGVKFS